MQIIKALDLEAKRRMLELPEEDEDP